MDGYANDNDNEIVALTAEIVSAYVGNNAVVAPELPNLIGDVHSALQQARRKEVEPEKVELVPAVPVKKSVTHEHIVCLEDGKKFKSLKRHLRTHYNLSPDEYRLKWGLPMTIRWWLQATPQLALLLQRAWVWVNAAGSKPAAAAGAAHNSLVRPVP